MLKEVGVVGDGLRRCMGAGGDVDGGGGDGGGGGGKGEGGYQRSLLVAGVTQDQSYLWWLLPCKKEKLCTLHFPHETGSSASTATTKASPEVFVGLVGRSGYEGWGASHKRQGINCARKYKAALN